MRVPTRSAGHEVGRELDAAERAAHDLGERAHRQRLGESGHALEQHVAAGEQRDEQALEHRVLPDDDALDLVQRLLEGLTGKASLVVVGRQVMLIGGGPFGGMSQTRRRNQYRDSSAPAARKTIAPPLNAAVSSRCSLR